MEVVLGHLLLLDIRVPCCKSPKCLLLSLQLGCILTPRANTSLAVYLFFVNPEAVLMDFFFNVGLVICFLLTYLFWRVAKTEVSLFHNKNPSMSNWI